MNTSLALAALTMGLLGGSHCAAMCAPLCPSAQTSRISIHRRLPSGGAAMVLPRVVPQWLAFHAARALAYAAAGALIAASAQSLAWFSTHVMGSNRLWMLIPVLSLSWGLVMLVFGRQPIWADRFLRSLWTSLSRLTAGQPWLAGLAWVLMPCGLLYAALALAALATSPAEGALVMGLFATGTTLWVTVAQRLWSGLQHWRGVWGMRLSGLALVVSAALVLSGLLVPDAAICGPNWR
jgi:uncharacterized protein